MSNEIYNKVEAIIKEIKSSAQVTMDAHLQSDLRFDSLDTMGLLFELEKAFNIKVPDSDVSDNKLSTIGSIVKYIEQKSAD